MTLEKLISDLQGIAKRNPELVDKPVHFWNRTDFGNRYKEVDYILTAQCAQGLLLCYDDGMM
jgi:hypothetical protein